MHVSLYTFSYIEMSKIHMFFEIVYCKFQYTKNIKYRKIYKRINFLFYEFYLIFLLNKYLLRNIKFTEGKISHFHLEINMLRIFSSLKVNLRFYFTEIIEKDI